mgnify:CR=1 FL=1
MDTSWIDEHKILLDTYHDKINFKNINSLFLYISNNDVIHTHKSTLPVYDNFIPKDIILENILNKKIYNQKKFYLKDILIFNIPIDHQEITTFNTTNSIDSFSTISSTINDIHIPKVLPILQKHSRITFIFVEQKHKKINSNKTKKVRFQLNSNIS